MRLTTFLLSAVLTISLFAFGCGGTDPNTNVSNANTANANSNAQKANTNSPVAVSTPVPEQTNNIAPTLTPVFTQYCLAMEKKDEATIRKVYSKDTLEYFAAEMKAEGSKSLVDYLSTDRASTKLCTIRNEVITGDTAIAEVKTESMPNGAKIVFVKEGNEWKITNRSPSLDAVKQTAQPAANSNTAK
jgi:hypothetical protein